jgi:hypothetical protein
MNGEEFVEAIKLYVRDSSVENVIKQLKNPSGRSVSPERKAHSVWYNGLSNDDRNHVDHVVTRAVHSALFGIFAVLDGVRVIDTEEGTFELVYVGSGGERVLLNDPNAMGLHDLLSPEG